MSRRLGMRLGFAAALVVLCAPMVMAQATTGRISGILKDTSGGVLPGVTVTVTETRTGFVRTDVSDAQGTYVFVNLPLGDYTVAAELQGFKKGRKSGYVLVADGRLTADFTLEVGAFSEVVQVTVQAETVNTVSGELARTVDRAQVQDLALNGRNYMQMVTLIPGAPLVDTTSPLDLMTGLGINTTVNGSRQNASLLTVDGGFNMDGGSNKFNSEYNAFQAKLTKRFSRGLQVLANYTWGKCMDDQSSLAEGKYQDFLNARADWSRCSYDITHAFKVGYVYDVPFGRGRQFGADWNRFVDGVLGGWAIEGIVQAQTGTYTNVRTGVDRANVGKTNERPNVLRNPNLSPSQRTVDKWFDTGAFVLQDPFTWGTAGAYMVQDDGRQIFDISIAKKFRLLKGHTLEFRTEMFNLPNIAKFGSPGSGGYIINTPTFGVITGSTLARQIQFALRYAF